MSKQLTCIKCGCVSEPYAPGGSVADLRESTGFSLFWDQSNGLDIVPVCPECVKPLEAAAEALVRVFGSKLRYISMLSIVHLVRGAPDDLPQR